MRTSAFPPDKSKDQKQMADVFFVTEKEEAGEQPADELDSGIFMPA
jgi:hypothetical protein